jgi:hypothetical protein
MRAAAPKLRDADSDDFVQMKAVGVTPDYVRELASAGFGNLESDDLIEARAVGVSAGYIRQMRAAGYNGSLDDFVEMKAVDVTPAYALKFKKAGYNVLDADQLVRFKEHDIDIDDLRNPPAPPPAPPRPPGG